MRGRVCVREKECDFQCVYMGGGGLSKKGSVFGVLSCCHCWRRSTLASASECGRMHLPCLAGTPWHGTHVYNPSWAWAPKAPSSRTRATGTGWASTKDGDELLRRLEKGLGRDAGVAIDGSRFPGLNDLPARRQKEQHDRAVGQTPRARCKRVRVLCSDEVARLECHVVACGRELQLPAHSPGWV